MNYHSYPIGPGGGMSALSDYSIILYERWKTRRGEVPQYLEFKSPHTDLSFVGYLLTTEGRRDNKHEYKLIYFCCEDLVSVNVEWAQQNSKLHFFSTLYQYASLIHKYYYFFDSLWFCRLEM